MEANKKPFKSRLSVDFTPLSSRNIHSKIKSIHRLLRFMTILLLILIALIISSISNFSFASLSDWISSISWGSSAQASNSIESNSISEYQTNIYGIDVSEWQQEIDWVLVSNDSTHHKIQFGIIKATEGKDHIDKFFKTNWKNADKAGLLRGAYHYYDFTVDPIWQAQNFINQVELKPGDLPPILDLENDASNFSNSVSSKQAMIVDIEIMLKTLEQHYSVMPIIYTNESFYKAHLSGFLTRYSYWIAKYSNEPPLGFGDTKTSNNYPRVAIWQYSNTGNVDGINSNVDLSIIPPSSWSIIKLYK